MATLFLIAQIDVYSSSHCALDFLPPPTLAGFSPKILVETFRIYDGSLHSLEIRLLRQLLRRHWKKTNDQKKTITIKLGWFSSCWFIAILAFLVQMVFWHSGNNYGGGGDGESRGVSDRHTSSFISYHFIHSLHSFLPSFLHASGKMFAAWCKIIAVVCYKIMCLPIFRWLKFSVFF